MKRLPLVAALILASTTLPRIVRAQAPQRADRPAEAAAPAPAHELRVAAACNASDILTPGAGLQVRSNDSLLIPKRIASRSYLRAEVVGNQAFLYKENVPRFVVFNVPKSAQVISIEAPGCFPQVTTLRPHGEETSNTVDADLEAKSWMARGATGSPDGFTLRIGPAWSSLPARLKSWRWESTDSGAGSFSASDEYVLQGFLSLGLASRHFTFDLDFQMGKSDVSGIEQGGYASGSRAAKAELTSIGLATRFGVRVPLHAVALSAGSGVGFTTSRISLPPNAGSLMEKHVEEKGAHVPLWAQVDLKFSCHFGVSGTLIHTASPSNLVADTFVASLLVQPSAACSTRPGIRWW
ncbi:MAG: hypothetical protein HY898_36095 [Deltaproteobacteria bacterium]|nr:hypothetical protein [Deltaproteobacteria bacterium]